MDFFTGLFYGNSSILYDSNDTFLWLSLIKRPGEHKLRVRAIDENGYKSQWSDTFVITAYERFKILSRLKELFVK